MAPGSRSQSIKKQNTPSHSTGKFDFYARLVKLKILRVDDTDVVSKYSTWLTALRSHPNAELKNDYVKLLVMGLDHPGQVYLFDEYPPAVIEPVEGGDWTAKARNVFFNVQCPRPVTANPPVVTAVSDDRRQFAAYQAVPKTGMQFYYAQSDDPLYLWYFKNNSASVPPADPLHAIPLDWERSLAGIRKTDEDPCDPGNTRGHNNIQITSSVDFNENGLDEAKPEHCKILDTLQENLYVEQAKFKWNEKSLLTGDTVPGSDMCIDWLIYEHDKTQLEIDEEAVRAFDKLYPDNFQLYVNPEFLEGIVKKLECAEENVKSMDKECAKVNSANTCQHIRFAGIAEERNCEKQTGNFPIKNEEDCGCLDNLFSQSSGHFAQRSPTDDINKCSDVLPSRVTEATKSFNCVVDKAEQAVKEVNDSLNNKKCF